MVCVLVPLATFYLWELLLLARFVRLHRRRTWVDAKPAEPRSEGDDPLRALLRGLRLPTFACAALHGKLERLGLL